MERAEASRLGKKAEAPPRRPATNCRRPRLRAARYSRSTCEGEPGRGPRTRPGTPPSSSSSSPPSRRRGGVRALDLEAALSFHVGRRTSGGPACRPVCERSAESPRRQVGDEIRSVSGDARTRRRRASTSGRACAGNALARAQDKSSREAGEQARVTRESSWHNMESPLPLRRCPMGFSAFRSASHFASLFSASRSRGYTTRSSRSRAQTARRCKISDARITRGS